MNTIFEAIRCHRLWRVAVVVLVLLGATMKSAQACGFTCIVWFGFIEISNGEVYVYDGCYQIGDTIYCYYGAVN